MRILGISCFYHDSAAALLEDGVIVAAAQEERFSRVKGDERFPTDSIRFCLDQAGISIDQVDEIVFYEKPLLKFERIIETYLNVVPAGLISYLTAMPSWLQKKLNQKKLLKSEFKKNFNFTPAHIFFSAHHLSHAASAFYASPFEKAAVLCLDGVGEWATTSAWLGDGSKLKSLWEIKFPHSLGLLYSTFTHYCGFKINSGEYKLMGLAPFGKPIYADLIKQKIIRLNPDGSYWLDTTYFGYLDDLVSTTKKFEKLFQMPTRKPESALTDFYKDVSASIQQVLNEAVLALARRLKQDTGADSICLAGGVALNCVANGLLVEQNIFEKIWVQPAAGDAGGALGAALALHYLKNGHQRIINKSDDMQGAFLGPDFSDQQIENCLRKFNLKFEKLDEEITLAATAKMLSESKIVGWFQGRMEYGPRALGSRSILGNPLAANIKSNMNLKIKFRESFRPFAPIVIDEQYDRYFSLRLKNEYMLLISKVKDTDLMPAITHVDGTARVQTIFKQKNKKLYRLLQHFEKLSGHAVLINTSFNVRSEPIVCKPEDAINCFLNTDIDSVVLGNFIVTKMDNPQIKRDSKWHEQFRLD